MGPTESKPEAHCSRVSQQRINVIILFSNKDADVDVSRKFIATSHMKTFHFDFSLNYSRVYIILSKSLRYFSPV